MSGAFELNGGQENGSLTNFIQFLGYFVSPLSGHIAILTEDGSADRDEEQRVYGNSEREDFQWGGFGKVNKEGTTSNEPRKMNFDMQRYCYTLALKGFDLTSDLEDCEEAGKGRLSLGKSQ